MSRLCLVQFEIIIIHEIGSCEGYYSIRIHCDDMERGNFLITLDISQLKLRFFIVRKYEKNVDLITRPNIRLFLGRLIYDLMI